jgi:hypothetical protein
MIYDGKDLNKFSCLEFLEKTASFILMIVNIQLSY